MFIEMYKCKMCGEKIQRAYVNDIEADTQLLKNRQVQRHFCKNGDIGIAEFVGFKKENS